MTVNAQTPVSGPSNCNGSNRNWSFDFKVIDATDMRLRITNADGTDPVVVSTGFTIDPQYLNNDAGGVVVYPIAPLDALPAGKVITRYREVPYTQPARIGNQGTFFPKTHEDAIDRVVMQVQQVKEQADRAIVVPVGSPIIDLDELQASVQEALNAADAAEGSADAAADSANIATNAASLAAGYKDDAEAAALAADASADAAAASATSAGTSETNAAASASSAAGSETNAANSASAASISASDANTSATSAGNSATAAAGSASAASTSATNAATSEAGAAAAATSALAGVGLGITGDAPILADLDNTSVPSGVYRVGSASTVGTWPGPGPNSAMVEYIRFNSGAGKQTLTYASGTGRRNIEWIRTFDGGSIWRPWRKIGFADNTHTPEDFGAVGDGSVDDTTAIQACLNAGGSIEFTPGKTYKITNTVEITQSKTTIIGYGATLRHETASLVDVLMCREKSRITILGLEIDGRRSLKVTSSQAPCRGIKLYSCSDVVIRDCYVHDVLERGIHSGNEVYTTVKASTYIRVINNRVENCGNTANGRGTGIWFFGEHFRSTIIGNVLTENLGGITADDVSSSGPQGLANEHLTIANNVVRHSSFYPAAGNTIGIWVGGSRYIAVTGNEVRGYRNAIMIEDSQANEQCAYISVTGNDVWGGPVGVLIRNAQYVNVAGNTIRASVPGGGDYPTDATGILVLGFGNSTVNRTFRISILGNLIISERKGISFNSPDYHPAIAGGVVGVDIRGNTLRYFGTPGTNDFGLDMSDGGVAGYIQDVVVDGNTADGFRVGYRYSSGITTECIITNNVAMNCTEYGFQITAAGQVLVGNTSRNNAVGIRCGVNVASVLIKDHTFLGDTANLSGTTSSVTKMNNYPTV